MRQFVGHEIPRDRTKPISCEQLQDGQPNRTMRMLRSILLLVESHAKSNCRMWDPPIPYSSCDWPSHQRQRFLWSEKCVNPVSLCHRYQCLIFATSVSAGNREKHRGVWFSQNTTNGETSNKAWKSQTVLLIVGRTKCMHSCAERK